MGFFPMMICVKCKSEMLCSCTGKKVVYGTDHVYSGDEFTCPGCYAQVIATNNVPYHDPQVLTRDPSRVLQMPQ